MPPSHGRRRAERRRDRCRPAPPGPGAARQDRLPAARGSARRRPGAVSRPAPQAGSPDPPAAAARRQKAGIKTQCQHDAVPGDRIVAEMKRNRMHGRNLGANVRFENEIAGRRIKIPCKCSRRREEADGATNELRLLTSAHMKSEVKTKFPDSESQTRFAFDFAGRPFEGHRCSRGRDHFVSRFRRSAARSADSLDRALR